MEACAASQPREAKFIRIAGSSACNLTLYGPSPLVAINSSTGLDGVLENSFVRSGGTET